MNNINNQIFVPKSIDHENITDREIEAYFSLKPINASNEDYHFDKHLDKLLEDYLKISRKFNTPNSKYSYKKRLKKMILVDKPENNKTYSHFLSWRLRKIECCKKQQREFMLDKTDHTNNGEIIKKLKLELLNKDKMIEDLQKENLELKKEQINRENLKNVEFEVQEIMDDEDVYVGGSESDSDDEYTLEPIENDFESYEDEVEYQKNQDKEIVKTKDEAVIDFQNKCISEIDKYYNEYINLKNNKKEKELINLQTDFFDKFQEEIIDEYLEELDENFDLDYDPNNPNCEYNKIQEKPLEKFKNKILY